jgi:hypothetical protein
MTHSRMLSDIVIQAFGPTTIIKPDQRPRNLPRILNALDFDEVHAVALFEPSGAEIAEGDDASCAPSFRASVGGSCHLLKSD